MNQIMMALKTKFPGILNSSLNFAKKNAYRIIFCATRLCIKDNFNEINVIYL